MSLEGTSSSASPKPKPSPSLEVINRPPACCLGSLFTVQMIVLFTAIVGTAFSLLYMTGPIQQAFLVFSGFQTLLGFIFFMIMCCYSTKWFLVAALFGSVTVCIVEFVYAVYILANDIDADCHLYGCTYLTGNFKSRIVLVTLIFFSGVIHFFLSITLLGLVLCVGKASEPPPPPVMHQSKIIVQHQRQRVSRRPRSRSSAKSARSSKYGSSKRPRSRSYSSSVRSQSSVKSQDASHRVAHHTDDFSTSWNSVSSVQPSYSVPSLALSVPSNASTCPYSMAILAHAQAQAQEHPQFQGQAAVRSTTFLHLPSQTSSEQTLQPRVFQEQYRGSDGYAFTLPAGAHYQRIVVRMPEIQQRPFASQRYQQPEPHRHRQQHNLHYPLIEFPRSVSSRPSVMHTVGSTPGPESSTVNFSQVSENNSVVLPSSFASKTQQGAQAIFIHNQALARRK